jgi:hypothetical protein
LTACHDGTIMNASGVVEPMEEAMSPRKYLWLPLILVFVAPCLPAVAEDETPTPSPPAQEKIVVTNTVKPREVRDYSVKAVMKGKAISSGSKEPIDLDTSTTLKIRHQYQRRGEDGLLPVDISFMQGTATSGSQVDERGETQAATMELTSVLYPKLTVLLDRDWQINDVYGMTPERLADQLPGIGYSNLIILFYIQGPSEPRAVGDRWESTVNVRGYGETYKFTNTLKSVELVDGVKAAIFRQEIARVSKQNSSDARATMKATVESAFALADGKLLKSHVDCEVITLPARDAKDRALALATVTIDVSLLKG